MAYGLGLIVLGFLDLLASFWVAKQVADAIDRRRAATGAGDPPWATFAVGAAAVTTFVAIGAVISLLS